MNNNQHYIYIGDLNEDELADWLKQQHIAVSYYLKLKKERAELVERLRGIDLIMGDYQPEYHEGKLSFPLGSTQPPESHQVPLSSQVKN